MVTWGLRLVPLLLIASASTSPHTLPPATKELGLKTVAPSETGELDVRETKVYLCGTAHVSSRSCEEVQTLIREVRPDLVMVELCPQRLVMLKPQDPEEIKNMTLKNAMASVKRKETSLVEALLSWVQAQSARTLDALPGEEFRVAQREAKECGALLVLGDRPCQVTLRRVYESLSRWQKVRLLFSVVWSGLFLSPRRMRKWLDKQLNSTDVVTEEILRLGKDFPSLVSTLIGERDKYMVARLRECIAVLRPKSIVAVVGAGHVSGIQELWRQALNATELAQLSRSESGAELYTCLPVIVTDDMMRLVNRQRCDSGNFTSLSEWHKDRKPLRFPVGAFVLARDEFGLYRRGRIAAQWYHDEEWSEDITVPYLVELEHREYIGVPIDDEELIGRDEFTSRMSQVSRLIIDDGEY